MKSKKTTSILKTKKKNAMLKTKILGALGVGAGSIVAIMLYNKHKKSKDLRSQISECYANYIKKIIEYRMEIDKLLNQQQELQTKIASVNIKDFQTVKRNKKIYVETLNFVKEIEYCKKETKRKLDMMKREIELLENSNKQLLRRL